MTITFLGTGTSTGVPQIGCTCKVCQSTDVRDKRFRSSIFIQTDDNQRILIDCTPDFRSQLLSYIKPQCPPPHESLPLWEIHALLITHGHADHIGGLDDLRPEALFGNVPLYTEESVANELRKRLYYCFSENPYPGIPAMELRTINAGEEFIIGNTKIMPLRVMHGNLPILGFCFEKKFAYITDMKTMPEETASLLQGVETLVINGLRHKPHNTHQTIEDAANWAKKLSIKQTFITHLSHDAGLHAESSTFLSPNVYFAHDGLQLTL